MKDEVNDDVLVVYLVEGVHHFDEPANSKQRRCHLKNIQVWSHKYFSHIYQHFMHLNN